MFYVKGKAAGGKFVVVNSEDGITEYHDGKFLTDPEKCPIRVEGVCDKKIFPVRPLHVVLSLIKRSDFHSALRYLPCDYKVYMSFVPGRNAKASDTKMYFYFKRTDYKKYEFFDCTLGRGFEATIDEVEDQLKYWSENLMLENMTVKLN